MSAETVDDIRVGDLTFRTRLAGPEEARS